jgi:hypothetical protein
MQARGASLIQFFDIHKMKVSSIHTCMACAAHLLDVRKMEVPSQHDHTARARSPKGVHEAGLSRLVAQPIIPATHLAIGLAESHAPKHHTANDKTFGGKVHLKVESAKPIIPATHFLIVLAIAHAPKHHTV